MRISSRGRYGLAAMITLAQKADNNESITVISISEKLGISKIYLEQVFSLLKRSGLVTAIKGAQGGYRLSKAPASISAFDILRALDQTLFEKTEESVLKKAADIEFAMQNTVFLALDAAITAQLEKVNLDDLVSDALRHKSDDGFMFYI